MAISIVLLLGLAITFYVYVSIHWFGVIRSKRQADVRSSKMLQAVSANPVESSPSGKFQEVISYASGREATIRRIGSPDVIVMKPKSEDRKRHVLA